MVIVEVILPDGRNQKGEIDETASISQIKKEIMGALMSEEDPNDYNIVLIPKNESITFANYSIRPNDSLLILSKDKARRAAWKPLTNNE